MRLVGVLLVICFHYLMAQNVSLTDKRRQQNNDKQPINVKLQLDIAENNDALKGYYERSYILKAVIEIIDSILKYEPKRMLAILRHLEVAYLLNMAPNVVCEDKCSVEKRLEYNRIVIKLGNDRETIKTSLTNVKNVLTSLLPNMNHNTYVKCMWYLQQTYDENDNAKFRELVKIVDRYAVSDFDVGKELNPIFYHLFRHHISSKTMGEFYYDVLLKCTNGETLPSAHYLATTLTHTAFRALLAMDDDKFMNSVQIITVELRRLGLYQFTKDMFKCYEFRSKLNKFLLSGTPETIKNFIKEFNVELDALEKADFIGIHDNTERPKNLLFRFLAYFEEFIDYVKRNTAYAEMGAFIQENKFSTLELQEKFRSFAEEELHLILDKRMTPANRKEFGRLLCDDAGEETSIYNNATVAETKN